MLSSERLEKILEYINRDGSVEVKSLSETFQVSEMTIRRDLKKLEESGLVFRIHGGASRKKPITKEVLYEEKKLKNREIKMQIAQRAFRLLEDSMTILLDAGTTTYELATLIGQSNLKDLTIVTNDLNIATHLYSLENIDVVIIGGRIVKNIGNTQGFLAKEALQNIFYDIAFIGVSAINEDLDVLTPSDRKVELKRIMIKNSQESVLLVDKSKLGQGGFHRITSITEFDYIITDIQFDEKQRKLMEKKNLEVINIKEDS